MKFWKRDTIQKKKTDVNKCYSDIFICPFCKRVWDKSKMREAWWLQIWSGGGTEDYSPPRICKANNNPELQWFELCAGCFAILADPKTKRLHLWPMSQWK